MGRSPSHHLGSRTQRTTRSVGPTPVASAHKWFIGSADWSRRGVTSLRCQRRDVTRTNWWRTADVIGAQRLANYCARSPLPFHTVLRLRYGLAGLNASPGPVQYSNIPSQSFCEEKHKKIILLALAKHKEYGSTGTAWPCTLPATHYPYIVAKHPDQ